MPRFRSIPWTNPDQAPPVPPCTGNWVGNADGSLTPADEATARAAGLLDDDDAPDPAPHTEA